MSDGEKRLWTTEELRAECAHVEERVFVIHEPFRMMRGEVDLALVAEAMGGSQRVFGAVLRYEEVPREAHMIEQRMRLSANAAQKLVDGLWDAGIRPSAGHGSVGHLAATEAHLRDLQRLVFGPRGPGKGA